ncbi:MAG TPA: hypothetical protein VFY71_11975 [Planctomycetota bacterium]|nr:hypothetical protein [Planctomycetota bacterium]
MIVAEPMLELPDWRQAWNEAKTVAEAITTSLYDRLQGNDERWAASADIADAQAVRCEFPRGSPWWIHAYLSARFLRGSRTPRNAEEALRFCVVLRDGIEGLDNEYIRRLNDKGVAPANYYTFLSHGAELLGRYCSHPPRNQDYRRADAVAFLNGLINQLAWAMESERSEREALDARVRKLITVTVTPSPVRQSPPAAPDDDLDRAVHLQPVLRKGAQVALTVSGVSPVDGLRVKSTIPGPTRSTLALLVMRESNRVHTWEGLLSRVMEKTEHAITSSKTLERQGRRIADNLPPFLRGYWNQDGQGVTWSASSTELLPPKA